MFVIETMTSSVNMVRTLQSIKLSISIVFLRMRGKWLGAVQYIYLLKNKFQKLLFFLTSSVVSLWTITLGKENLSVIVVIKVNHMDVFFYHYRLYFVLCYMLTKESLLQIFKYINCSF